jgi:TonB-linked SusC/RagA family outer membrane protein
MVPYAQEKSGAISGKVVTNVKEPIGNAVITVDHSTFTTLTDENGDFMVPDSVASENLVLTVEATGYHIVKKHIYNKKEVQFILVDVNSKNVDSKLIDNGDFVLNEVNTLGLRKSVEDNEILATNTSVENSLQGRIAGFSVTDRSGAPGEGAMMMLRSYKSLNADNMPLIILDGAIVEFAGNMTGVLDGVYSNPLANINPNDVESVTVLKGPETAIYGSLAANGAVIIETKKSTGTNSTVQVRMSKGIATAPDNMPVLNAMDYTGLMNELVYQKYDATSVESLFPGLVSDKSSPSYQRFNNETEWQDEVFDQGSYEDYYINVQGGDAVAHYSLSLGYQKQNGIIKNTDFTRYTNQINAFFNITPKFKISTNLGYSINKNAVQESGLIHARNPLYSALFKAPSMAPNAYDPITGRTTFYLDPISRFNVSNPVSLVNNEESFIKTSNVFAKLNATYSFNDNMEAYFAASYNNNNVRQNLFVPGASDNTVAWKPGSGTKNMVAHSIGLNQQTYVTGALRYKKHFLNGNDLKVALNTKLFQSRYELDNAEGVNTSSDQFASLSNVTSKKFVSGGLDSYNYMSFGVNANYGIAGKYFLNGLITTDKSSVFSKSGDFGLFYASGLGWLASNEAFLHADWLNQLKFNISYGVSGNSQIQSNAGQYIFVSNRFRNVNGVVRMNIPSEGLEAEKVHKIDFNTNLVAFNKRLMLNFNVYNETTKNMLLRKESYEFLGFENFLTNGGELTTSGIELGLNVNLVSTNDWKINVGGTFAKSQNEIKSLDGDQKIYTAIEGGYLVSEVGRPANQFYGYKTNGVFATQAQADKAGLTNPVGQSYNAGDVIFEDSYKDGVIDQRDMMVIGDANPDFFGGFNIDLSYKRFYVNSLFSYKVGGDIYNYRRSQMERMADTHNQATSVQRRWIKEGQVTDMPKATYGDPMGNAVFSDRWIEDGSYLKLKNITLGFNISESLIKGIKGGSIYISADNLFTVTDYLGFDPEFYYGNNVTHQGVDYGLTPLSSKIVIGLKINL